MNSDVLRVARGGSRELRLPRAQAQCKKPAKFQAAVSMSRNPTAFMCSYTLPERGSLRVELLGPTLVLTHTLKWSVRVCQGNAPVRASLDRVENSFFHKHSPYIKNG